MTQTERRRFLLSSLLAEAPEYRQLAVPDDAARAEAAAARTAQCAPAPGCQPGVFAGAGLSTSAGFTYAGERFRTYFSDFASKYGFTDMYSGGFYPYPTMEEYWAYWSRYIYINRYQNAPKARRPSLLAPA